MSVKLQSSSPDVSPFSQTTQPELSGEDRISSAPESGPRSHRDRTTRRDAPASVRGRRSRETDELHAALDAEARRAFRDAVGDSEAARKMVQQRRIKIYCAIAGVVLTGVGGGLWLARASQDIYGATQGAVAPTEHAQVAADAGPKGGPLAPAAPSPGVPSKSADTSPPAAQPMTPETAQVAPKAVAAVSGDKALQAKATLEKKAQAVAPSDTESEGATSRRWFGAK